ncbi:MAG: DUF2786 domain-containing protein [Candidatus Electrothrix sp. AW3_4]|nr:DUF2786 domain-containing protein [Candidatus Electrothrix gigas]
MANRKFTQAIPDAIQQVWLEQLIREFEDICWYYKVSLRTPIFELSTAQQQLGCWLPEQRILRISQHLIASSSWDVVLMVLKHEMAHQVCSEYFGLKQAGHGKEFQQACQLLGVSFPYNRSTGDLPDVLVEPSANEQTEEGRKVIRRVNKLLALAGSDNEHEATLAMQRATELLHRHNLAMSALAERSGCVRLVIQTGKKQIPTWRKDICLILKTYFFVEVIYTSLYDAERQDSYKTIELLGRAENVPIAEHCYYFLKQQLASLWQKNRHRFQGNTRTAKNSYYLGVLEGFSQKLAEQAKKVSQENQRQREAGAGELIISNDRGVQEFIKLHFPRLQRTKRNTVQINKDSYEKAVVAGKNIVLHQSLTEKKQGSQRLLL